MATSKEVKDKRYKILREQLATSGLSTEQQAYLLGQIKKETGNFDSLTEKYNGDRKEYFEGKYGFNTSKGRELGNTKPGEGEKYRGRGYIQITGKANYAKYNDALYPEEANLPLEEKTLVKFPEKLEDPELGGKASLAYIQDRAKNFSSPDDLTKAINGGLFSAARSRDPEKKQTALADIQARRQYAAEYLNILDKEKQEEAQRQLNTEALGSWDDTNPQMPAPQGVAMSPADIRNYAAERDVRNYQGMEPGIKEALSAEPQYVSMEELLGKRGILSNPFMK